jgi:hypothetical protein
MSFWIKFTSVSLLSTLFFGCSNSTDKSTEHTIVITSNLEKVEVLNGKKLIRTNEYSFLAGGDYIDSSESKSGKNSIKLMKGREFGLTYIDSTPGPMSHYSISVFALNGEGVLVFDAGTSKGIKLYEAKNYSTRPGVSKWEKLTIDYVLPDDYDGKQVKIYCWNPNTSPAWFDDIRISIERKYQYPIIKDLPQAEIQLSDDVLKQLKQFRITAFERGILMKSEKVELPASLTLEGTKYNATVRLKGDWLDHIQGNKWSFKVKLKDGQKWRGMTQFAFQSPNRRDYQNEWLIHKWMEKEGIITTEYEFVSFSLNGKPLGLYVYEEQCNQNMIVKKELTEGIVLKYTEDAVWEVNEKILGSSTDEVYYPVLPASVIAPFNKSSVFKDSRKTAHFYRGQELLQTYLLNKSSVSETFNIDALAKFYAISEIARASHGFIFHNIRYYYNSESDRIEPISYDNYNDKGEIAHYYPVNLYNLEEPIEFGMNDQMGDWMLKRALMDLNFRNLYVRYLIKYSSKNYVDELLEDSKKELKIIESYLKLENEHYTFNWGFIKASAKNLRKRIKEYDTIDASKVLNSIVYPERMDKLSSEECPGENLSVICYKDKVKNTLAFVNLTAYDAKVMVGTKEIILPKYEGVEHLRPTEISYIDQDNWVFTANSGKTYPVKMLKWGYRVGE